jgi:hypothetical protein
MYRHGRGQPSRELILQGWRPPGTRMDTGLQAKAHQSARKVRLPRPDRQVVAVTDQSVDAAEGQFTKLKWPVNLERGYGFDPVIWSPRAHGECPPCNSSTNACWWPRCPMRNTLLRRWRAMASGTDSSRRLASVDQTGLLEPVLHTAFYTANENGARKRRKSLFLLVGGTGFEPVTPAV